jgi:hypothetical protein
MGGICVSRPSLLNWTTPSALAPVGRGTRFAREEREHLIVPPPVARLRA